MGGVMMDKLKSGMAALEAAHVTPLCLTIRNDGEWHFYKTIALPGHPDPCNAKHGFSHPMPLSANVHRTADWRVNGKIEQLPSDRKEAMCWGEKLAQRLWPNSWTIYLETDLHSAEIVAMDVVRRITDIPLLVAIRISCGERTVELAQKGGRP